MDVQTYIKRLTTIQNMTDTSGVKELCELIMDLLEDTKKNETGLGFHSKAKKDEK